MSCSSANLPSTAEVRLQLTDAANTVRRNHWNIEAHAAIHEIMRGIYDGMFRYDAKDALMRTEVCMERGVRALPASTIGNQVHNLLAAEVVDTDVLEVMRENIQRDASDKSISMPSDDDMRHLARMFTVRLGLDSGLPYSQTTRDMRIETLPVINDRNVMSRVLEHIESKLSPNQRGEFDLWKGLFCDQFLEFFDSGFMGEVQQILLGAIRNSAIMRGMLLQNLRENAVGPGEYHLYFSDDGMKYINPPYASTRKDEMVARLDVLLVEHARHTNNAQLLATLGRAHDQTHREHLCEVIQMAEANDEEYIVAKMLIRACESTPKVYEVSNLTKEAQLERLNNYQKWLFPVLRRYPMTLYANGLARSGNMHGNGIMMHQLIRCHPDFKAYGSSLTAESIRMISNAGLDYATHPGAMRPVFEQYLNQLPDHLHDRPQDGPHVLSEVMRHMNCCWTPSRIMSVYHRCMEVLNSNAPEQARRSEFAVAGNLYFLYSDLTTPLQKNRDDTNPNTQRISEYLNQSVRRGMGDLPEYLHRNMRKQPHIPHTIPEIQAMLEAHVGYASEMAR